MIKSMKYLNYSILNLIFISLLIPLPLIEVGGFTSGLYLYHILSLFFLVHVAYLTIKNDMKVKVDRYAIALFAYFILCFFVNGFDLTKEWVICIISFLAFFSANLYASNVEFKIEKIVFFSKYYLFFISFLGLTHYLNNNYLYVNPYVIGEGESDDFVFTGFLGLTRGSIGVIFPVLISISLIDFFKNNFKNKIFIAFSIFLAILCVLLSGSRTGLLLCIISVFLNFLIFRSKSIANLILIGFLCIFISIPYFYDYINLDRFNNLSTSYSVESRKEVQTWTINYMINHIERFIIGEGYDSRNFVKSVQHELTHPHNEFLYTIWSIGILGFILYIAFLYNTYVNCQKKYRNNLIILYFLFFIGSMSVGSILTPSLRLAYFGFFGFFILRTFSEKR